MSTATKRRYIDATELSVRAEGEAPPTLVGYAAVFDVWTTLYKSPAWELREVIRPGAFRDAIAEAQDVRALFNHANDNVLGRTTNGTLRLSEDSRGLRTEIDPPDDWFARRVAGLIRRGDVSQMSFAFLPRSGGERQTTRTVDGVEIIEVEITSVNLYDIAPVTYPAYDSTEIGLRGLIPDVAALVAARSKRAKGSWLREARAKSEALARRLNRA